MENLTELKAIPKNATPRVQIGGTTFYGSRELDQAFIEAVRKEPIVNPVWKKIAELINAGTVNPCYLSKGIFSFLINKIFSPHEESGTLGFFSPKTKKIYIIVDNWAGLFGNAPDEGISRTLIHECTHLFANKKPNEYFSLVKEDMGRYYGEFLTRYFRVDKYDMGEMQDLVKFVFYEFEMSTKDTIDFKEYWNRLEKLFMKKSNLNSNEFDYRVKIYFTMIKFLFTNLSALRQYYLTAFRDMYVSMFNGYRAAFNIKPHGTLLVQELVFPSEIMCVVASHGMKGDLGKVYAGINKI